MSFFDPFGVTDKLSDVFGGGQQEGYEELMKMLQQGMGEMKGYTNEANALLSPYRDIGMGQTNFLQQAIANMSNPNEFYNKMMSGYQESPMATRQRQMGTNDALAAASASGMTGSSDLLSQINQQSQNISNQDQQKYFNNMMGINNQGLGMAQNLYNTGYGATGQMSGNLSSLARAVADMYGQMGQAKMGQAQAGNQGLMGMLGGLGGLFSSLPAGGLLGALAL